MALARIPVSVQSFDWCCIRALIVPTVDLGGAGAPGMNYALRLVQTDVPNSTCIVASFGGGNPSEKINRSITDAGSADAGKQPDR
ncbi:hypothetical protein L7Q78_23280 [Achromobacter xylosoxidans]|uniref:hypothetical protein n=1 Tax=Alcaligenes xylosoxydans xylosoxydans TaxID=85698 RepID=UPI001F0564A3|nr:hypothetical protein [Achromobacter xylosoxidans]MCH1984766.1 hypothetical protein [Achromobacter xylosoxidans]MCH1995719.1 hypothetical protein [Achromobacter xylosoxidans]MCH4584433.1 hypothetical protein [Achromobacter xylosoxidans]